MITLLEQDKFCKALSFMGLSTDEKPVDVFNIGPAAVPVVNSSAFYEIDTGDLYLFEEENTDWVKQNIGGGGGGGYPEPTGQITITSNGTKNVKNYAQAVVNVPQGVFPSGALNIAANGTYDVSDKASAVVNVPNPSTGELNINSNGTYDVTDKASAVVNVPDTANMLIARTISGNYVNNVVPSVGDHAFEGCNDLESVSMGAVTRIGANAFKNSPIVSASFPQAVVINEYAFNNAAELESLNIPRAEIIRDSAFEYCALLRSVTAGSLDTIWSNAFHGCWELQSMDLSSLRELLYGGFSGSGLIKAEMPLLETIESRALSACPSLTVVDIGAGVSSLPAYLFELDTALTAVILRRTSVVTLEARSAFNGSSIASGSGYIYVPDNLVESYRTATNWVYFSSRIRGISELPSNI